MWLVVLFFDGFGLVFYLLSEFRLGILEHLKMWLFGFLKAQIFVLGPEWYHRNVGDCRPTTIIPSWSNQWVGHLS